MNTEGGATKFAKRCLPHAQRVKEKKSKELYEGWKQELTLYDVTVKYLKSKDRRPKDFDEKLWNCLQTGYLEQCVSKSEGRRPSKRMRFSTSTRSKMRITG